MKRTFAIVALCASVWVPGIAGAQQGPPAGPMGPGGMGPGDRPSPSPAMRAAMEQARAEAKAAAFAALTPAHVTGVQAIIAQVTAGTLDRRTAAQQIDALLTADERSAVIGAAEKARREMRAAMMGVPPPPPDAGPPSGPPGPPPDRREMFGPPSAGRTLVMLSMTPRDVRSIEPVARRSPTP